MVKNHRACRHCHSPAKGRPCWSTSKPPQCVAEARERAAIREAKRRELIDFAWLCGMAGFFLGLIIYTRYFL